MYSLTVTAGDGDTEGDESLASSTGPIFLLDSVLHSYVINSEQTCSEHVFNIS